MQAYYETETEVLEGRQIAIKLPDNIPLGRVKLAVIYEINGDTPNTKADKKKRMSEFLASLSDSPSSGLSRAEVSEFVEQERQSWD